MIRLSTMTVLTGVTAALLGVAPDVHAHATYNLSGYGSGLGGSTNGADGNPAGADRELDERARRVRRRAAGAVVLWPAQPDAGPHHPDRAGGEPAVGQLARAGRLVQRRQRSRPPIDTVLAVGGLSWTDPSNDNQGWGHGLDFGLIHVSPPGRARGGRTRDADDHAGGRSDRRRRRAARLRPLRRLGHEHDRGAPPGVRHQPGPVDNPLGRPASRSSTSPSRRRPARRSAARTTSIRLRGKYTSSSPRRAASPGSTS